jgi:hypothetical protein
MGGSEHIGGFRSWARSLADSGARGAPLARSYARFWRELGEQRGLVAAEPAGAGAVAAWRYGTSVLGEPLWAFATGPAAAPVILVIAGLHALEHVGPLAASALLARAAAEVRAGAGPWSKRRLVVAPLANPDGFRAVEAARASGRRAFLRGNGRGVDLNRNFAEAWRGGAALGRLLPRVFAPGSGPLSEPEAAALDALAAAVRPAAVVSLHAFGEWIYVPWANRREPPAESERLLGLARAMAARQAKPYGVVQLGRRSRLFTAGGAEIDHFLARHGALSFLIEIGQGPRLGAPSTWFDPYRWYTADEVRLQADIAQVLPALDALAEAELAAR